jgi:(p)ppGpp synthase/HD superfamily hydrolase
VLGAVGNVALEVQVRTRSMDITAEDGKASHGYYKDSVVLTSHIPSLPLASDERIPQVCFGVSCA